MHADDDNDDNTRNGNRRFLTSSLTLHMKDLNISEVTKRYNQQTVETIDTRQQSVTK